MEFYNDNYVCEYTVSESTEDYQKDLLNILDISANADNLENLIKKITDIYNEINDNDRILYLDNYMREANKANVNITHYYVWSFLDNFEWDRGFNERFGLIYIDFNSKEKTRKKKNSIIWLYQKFFE